ncbi:hypothetical protein MBANPS3_001278 [Mucor bainieri]
MRSIYYSAATVLAVAITSTNAQTYVTPAPRRSPNCALLSEKIYCFGGYGVPVSAAEIYAPVFALDISNVHDNFATKWENISDAANANFAPTEARPRSQAATPSDGKNLLVSGGQPYSDNSTTPQHLVYNVESKSWRSLAELDDGPNGKYRQIYLGTATYVPEQSKFYFYGGVEVYPTKTWYLDTLTNVNITNAVFENSPIMSKLGYYKMTTLDISSTASNPWQIIPQKNAPSNGYYLQSSVYHASSKKIYYFGGYYNNLNGVGTENSSFSEALVFDTATSSWGNQIFTGSAIPTQRGYHTLTLLPSNQDLLLYGGSQDGAVSKDFCYVANLASYVWSSCSTIRLSDNSTASRAEHSAVLDEKKKIVYILFGYDKDVALDNTFSTVLALNVSDPKAVAFVDSTQTAQPVEITVPVPSKGKSSGSIIGGAVGGAVGGVLIIGLIAFFMIKKKKKNAKKLAEEDRGREPSVDWDAMEGGYIETYPVPATKEDIYAKHNKPYEPSTEEQEAAMMKYSPVVTPHSNAETAVASSVNVPDVAIMNRQQGGDHVTKPDVAL